MVDPEPTAPEPSPSSAPTAPSEHTAPASRTLAVERGRLLSEVGDRHAVTLESLLAVLRSSRLDDRTARSMAVDIAAAAMVEVRTVTDQERNLDVEPVVGAFSRLRTDLRPLVRFGDLDVQFVEPPATGRALPGEVAHAARAIVRSSVLAFVDQGESRRVRIQWDCDGLNLLVSIRDDGRGDLSLHDDSLRPVAERVASLDGTLTVSSTSGWGSELSVVLPLDPPTDPPPLEESVPLSAREREVLRLVASGARNKAIATDLSISENTVKFHVSNLLRKVGASTRAELASLAR